jgi:hypothetical protein
VLDVILPARADGTLPGAGRLGLADEIARALQGLPELRALIREGLRDVDVEARRTHARRFADLGTAEQVHLLEQQAFVLPLTMQAYAAYYREPRVLSALGLAARAPHPHGYEMEGNDLTSLDAVRRRPPLYRRAPE